MKAIFPKKGVVIVTKYNVNTLKDYYKNNLINSKLFGVYQQSNYSINVGNYAYLPQKSNIILDKSHLLTITQLQEYVLSQMKIKQNSNISENNAEKVEQSSSSNKPLDDNFIKDNSFFTTLTYLDN